MNIKNLKITKVLNNNVVFTKNEMGQDVIVTGLGIGFQRKKQDIIDNKKIERIFVLDEASNSNELSLLLKQIPMEYFYLADKIKKLAENKLKNPLSPNIYLTLSDHIWYAVQRYKQGLLFQTQIMWEIKRFYPDEYKIAKEALNIINLELNTNLPSEEAIFIAFHIVNSEVNGPKGQYATDVIEIIKEICDIVRSEFNIEFDENSLEYTRFILHLKFFAQRLLTNSKVIEKADFLYDQLKLNMVDSFDCANKIAKYIKEKKQYNISKSEIVYMTVHIQRVTASSLK